MKGEARLTPDLPERFAVLYNYQTGKFNTPLTPQGIADIDGVFELAIRTYPDELPSFADSERNIHHIYWTESWWEDYAASHPASDCKTITEFRTSTPQLAYVPVPIHQWIERVMVPPPPPSLEIMRRRNAAWEVATRLLRGAVPLERARTDYDEKKDSTRIVLGNIDGITPRSKRRDQLVEERLNRGYWLSELNERLGGWKTLTGVIENVPSEDRFIQAARLSNVRALKSRIRHGALVPRLPKSLLIAA